jgi:chaperonin GroES
VLIFICIVIHRNTKQKNSLTIDLIILFKTGERSMNIRPLHDRVIVKRLEEELKTASGIIIPDSAAEKPDQGEIISVGKGKVGDDGKIRALDVKVGDKVLFGKYSGQAVKIKGEEILVMREEDIMGIVEG